MLPKVKLNLGGGDGTHDHAGGGEPVALDAAETAGAAQDDELVRRVGSGEGTRERDGGSVILGILGEKHFGDRQDASTNSGLRRHAADACRLAQHSGSEALSGSHNVVVHE